MDMKVAADESAGGLGRILSGLAYRPSFHFRQTASLETPKKFQGINVVSDNRQDVAADFRLLERDSFFFHFKNGAGKKKS